MKTKLWKVLALALVALMAFSVIAGCKPQEPVDTSTPTDVPVETAAPPESPTETAATSELPRNETLYFAGLQWGAVKSWSPYNPDPNNSMAISQAASARIPLYETLYMYNMLDGQMYPLLADGAYVWNADLTQMTVKIKSVAKWSDGTPVTAADVAYTYATHLKYASNTGNEYKDYIDKIEAVDESTVVIYAKLNAEGKPVNPLMLLEYIGKVYVTQKAYFEGVEAAVSSDPDAFKSAPCEDPVGSGPYKVFLSNDQKVILVRDDSYWGQDASMWGQLPVPKYLAHTIFTDNNAAQVAFSAGEVDVSQGFTANIQDFWLTQGLPISTYMDEPPYGVCASIPTAWYNMGSPGLDNVAVRKAIAMAVDYEAIIANAMTNQSPTFAQCPRSMMIPTDGEQALLDSARLAPLQWAGNDIEGAKALLDSAGIVDTNGDGYRDINGQNLEYNACCPNGWTDWQAAIEIVAAAGQNIGINITTEFPEADVFLPTVFTTGQTDYDIFMMWNDGAGPIQPWARIRKFMSSEFLAAATNATGNFGGYVNPEADEIIKQIPSVTDPAELKELYTRINEIYLTDVPSFALMYRPELFHAVNETVWTGFPEQGDGLNIPPLVMINGYGIAGLYHVELVNP
ncbi:MAG TPA: ABC transporter substrate-binding protein [Clostridia bacterium]|nr:ABC transporter substrate-binding protein [Clostridia bacterium]